MPLFSCCKGRDERAEGEALGRVLSIVFFEKEDVGLDGIRVRPVENDGGHLKLKTATIAEISRAMGYHPPVADNMDARQVEILHEDHHKTVLTYDCTCICAWVTVCMSGFLVWVLHIYGSMSVCS